MKPADWIALAALLAMISIAIWGAFRAQAKSDARAQWAKINELERKVQHLETLVSVLKKGMEALPTGDEMRDRLEALAVRMEGRLDAMGQTLQATLLEFAKKAARP